MFIYVKCSRIDPCCKLSDTGECNWWDRYTNEAIPIDNVNKTAIDHHLAMFLKADPDVPIILSDG